MTAPNEDSDQPGHPPSLIRVFAVRMKKGWILSYPLSAKWRLIRLGGCPGWSESSLGAQIILLVLSWGGSNEISILPKNDNTAPWYYYFRSYITKEVKGPEVNVPRSDLTLMVETAESARIKLYKQLEVGFTWKNLSYCLKDIHVFLSFYHIIIKGSVASDQVLHCLHN